MKYWLLKSEPETFGIDHLARSPKQITPWEGVRNYQARNLIRDEISKGDLAFFYHSSCAIPGITGIVKVVTDPYPDITALDPESQYYDPKSSQENNRWYRVDVQLLDKFKTIIPLSQLREVPELRDLALLRRGNRLSVQPVTKKEWDVICSLAK